MSNFNMLSSVIVNVVLGIVVHQTLRHHVEQQRGKEWFAIGLHSVCAFGIGIR